MAAKTVLIVFASACCVKMIAGQCLNSRTEDLLGSSIMANRGAYGQLPGPYNAYGPTSGQPIGQTCGGGFAVTSVSPISPTGVSVVSDNAIEGALLVTGELPFLGAIAFEGVLPTAGSGGVNYGCGDGNVEITSEGLATAASASYGPGYAPGPAGGMPYGPGFGYGIY